MSQDIERAAQYCEERKVDKLASLVPKVVEVNAVVVSSVYN